MQDMQARENNRGSGSLWLLTLMIVHDSAERCRMRLSETRPNGIEFHDRSLTSIAHRYVARRYSQLL